MSIHKNKFSNPIIKDEIEILEDSPQCLVFRTYLYSNGGQAKLHYHTTLIEKFKIIEGELHVIINQKEHILVKGDQAVIHPLEHHRFYNPTDKAVIFDVKVTNPKQLKNALQIMYGLAKTGKTYKNGLPKNIFHTAISLRMMDSFVPGIPLLIQKLGISILAYLGKILRIEKKLLNTHCN